MDQKNATYRLVMNSLFVVLAILLSRLLAIRIPIGNVEVIRFGFGTIPMFLSAFIFGPLDGFIVGGLSDLIGYWINPMGAFLPQFTLTSALHGLIPGIVFRYFFKRRINYWSLAISCGLGEAVGITLTPFFLHQAFGISYAVLMPPRIGGYVVSFFLNALIMFLLLTRIPQINKMMEKK